ncbi:IQ motif and ubiquitin-like domain-containing protein isoform X6 [Syngnathus scovelli]|uniref:IQ motif and ubiquitin-like domain-containing protein isoform X6 n=1 Tax=Syngnathus scovelli TaxID=161590 RepID=UPI0021108402|nr:IQ and ubiquitin-like domain-containing protein isoform X5 [Syngnathus scovelli]
MSDDEVDTIIPPESEENQGEPQGQENQGQAGEERKEEALRESEDQGEPANEDESLPGASNFEEQGEPVNEEPSPEVSTSEDQGEAVNEEPIPGVSTFDDQEEPVNEEESLPGVSTTEEQDEPVNEEEGAKGTLPEDDQGQPGIENETLPGASTSEDQREPRSQVEQGNEPSSQVKTLADQGEPGNEDEIFSSEDQREPRSQVEQGNEPSSQVKTLADQGEPGNEDEIFSSEDQAEPRMEEDQAAETSAGVKTSDGGQERRLSESPGSEPHGAVAAGTTASSSEPLAARADSEQHENPDVINVSLRTDDSAPTDVSAGGGPPPAPQKAFLGGYRHKLTGTEYHHAASQTPRRARPGRGVDVVSRDAQTAEQVLQAQQCDSSVTTQMTRVGCYISNMKDRLLSPGHYITADEYHHTRLKAVIRLQAHTRRWLSCRAVDRLRQERDRRLAWLDLQERRRHEERAEQLQDSHSRWMQPRKREDLNLLYNALEKWRSDKERQINATLRGAERKAALCSLLEQETQYIATIGRHGIAIRSNNYNKAVRKFLDKSSTAHQWRAADGRLIEMDTPDTIRARELGDLYDCVAMSPVSPEQRLDILLCLKQTVEEHPCPLTRDIVELIGREEDLMRRQVKEANLEGLRKRLCTYFLQFIRTPGFNPEVAKHLKVPQSTAQLKNDVFLCHGCQRHLGSAHFRSCARSHLSRRCLDCTRLRNIAGSRDDFSCYKYMLKRLRDAELLLNKDNIIPFILQVEDIQYLVEVIWGSHSALSGCSDLYSLVLVRWDRQKDWSPWNCVLLCKDETDAHLLVEDLLKVYDVPVVRSVEHKHLLARRHYNQIPTMVAHSAKAAAAAAAAAQKRGALRK